MEVESSNNDWKKCIICQESKFPKKNFPISKGTEAGIARIVHCADARRVNNDVKFGDCCPRILGCLTALPLNQDVFWHRKCYSDFTNEGHIQRLKNQGDSAEQTPSIARRSSKSPMDWSKCMFCQTHTKKLSLNQVETIKTSDNILSNAVSDKDMSYKLGGVTDLIAAEGKYHLNCYSSFMRKAKKKSQDPPEVASSTTQSLNANDVSDDQSHSDEECVVTSDGNDKDDDFEVVDEAKDANILNAELLSWLYRVGVKVHHDIKTISGHDCIGNINQESAKKLIPESLMSLISLLCFGHQEEEEECDQSLKNRILSICQDIFFLANQGRKLTPKHVGLGLTVHQATRSKELVQLLHSAGHSVSYETVLRMDNSIANDVLKRYKDNGNVFVPCNFKGTAEYTRYAIDNIDINEETLSGLGTFHATQVAAFCRKEDVNEQRMELEVTPRSSRQLDLQVPSELHDLKEIALENEKPEPVNQETKIEWYTPDENKINESYRKDFAWILGRLSQEQPEIQKVPGWSGFNQLLSNDKSEVTIVGPLPIINAPAHEFETLWTAIHRCKSMTELRGGLYTVITMDEGLYNKAKMLQWAKPVDLKNVILVLGGFHTQMAFSKVIGKYLESSGMLEVWTESDVFGETTAENILKGRHWNRVIRAHKLTYEALWRALWPVLIAWAKDKEDTERILSNLSDRLGAMNAEEASTQTDAAAYSHALDEVGQALDIVKDFDASHQDNPTFRYWRQYMHLVSILLRFTRAIREGDWELYLSSFAEMLPWFSVFDHVNYTRWGAVFLADMKSLQRRAPEVHEGFNQGDFVTKETSAAFNQIPDDQALEHVNKSGKVAGGLVGITRTDSARDRWCLTYNERAQLSEDTKSMYSIVSGGESSKHKDLTNARTKRDGEDVLKLTTLFMKYDVFRQTENLVVVTTGDVASDAIKDDLLEAEEKGQTRLKEFVQHRLINKSIKFHESVKQQKLKTFETLYSVDVSLNSSKTITIKADRDLLRRVVVALEAGRDVDVDALLKRELSPVPLSIATLDGSLRPATAKSDLSSILQENVYQTRPPMNHRDTCTIIDGMAVVQSLGSAGRAKTFGEWCDKFVNNITSHFSDHCTRVDLVFDRYGPDSIKQGTRAKRKGGKKKGIRRDVESRDQRIGSWERFIAVDENKASLAHFLSSQISQTYPAHPRRELVISGGFHDVLKVWSSTREDVRSLSSDHEEADTRIVLHARDATLQGYRQVNVLCQDTDVLVLLLAHRQDLCDVWMISGTSRKRRYVPIQKITITEEKRMSLLAFHAITGCDTTSQFAGIGKATAWKAFDGRLPELLKDLGSRCPPNEEVLVDAEAFICKLYNNNTEEKDINKVRASSFRKIKKNLDTLPPTKDALYNHIRRANFQTMIWKAAQDPRPAIPTPEGNGWYCDDTGKLKARLLTQEEVSAECLELSYCGCSSERSCGSRRCTCVRLSLPCSKACKCADTCINAKNFGHEDEEDEYED